MIEVKINETGEKKEEVKKYPYVGLDKSRGTMVLFVAPGEGMAVVSTDWSVGDYETCWAEDCFTPVPSITITSRTE